MKKFLMMAAVALVMAACQTNRFKIAGTTDCYADGDTFYLADLNMRPTDTMVVKKGRFKLKGVADRPVPALLFAQRNRDDVVMLFKEPGTISVKMNGRASESRVSGTKANDGLQALTNQMNDLERQFDRLTMAMTDTTMTDTRREAIAADYERLQQALSQMIYQAAQSNIDNGLGRFIVSRMAGYLTPEELQTLTDQMSEE